jgi:hypothetical protein
MVFPSRLFVTRAGLGRYLSLLAFLAFSVIKYDRTVSQFEGGSYQFDVKEAALHKAPQNERRHCRFSIADCQFASFVLRALYFDEGSAPDSELLTLRIGNRQLAIKNVPSGLGLIQVHQGPICS